MKESASIEGEPNEKTAAVDAKQDVILETITTEVDEMADSLAVLAQLSSQTNDLHANLSATSDRLRSIIESKKRMESKKRVLEVKDTRCGRSCYALGVNLVHMDLNTTRRKMGHMLESHFAHAIILCLVFLDVMAVLCEVMLRNVCVVPEKGTSDDARLYVWGEGLAWFSRVVLFILLLHLALLIFSFGAVFFKKFVYVVDLVVVLVALGLEMAHLGLEFAAEASGDPHLESKYHEAVPAGLAGDGGTLIVILLCWRVIRIVHGFYFAGTAHTDEQELEEANEQIEALAKRVAEVHQSVRRVRLR